VLAHLALLVQIPAIDIARRIEEEKGSPLTDRERAILDERIAAARAWLDAYAPERARLVVRFEGLPPEAAGLESDQRAFLDRLATTVASTELVGGDAWQSAIFAAAIDAGVPAGRAFAAIYLAFLGRTNGPRAGWLLATLDPAFVLDRLHEAAGPARAGDGGVA
jgi:lysyl-tRNA synthetase class 1